MQKCIGSARGLQPAIGGRLSSTQNGKAARMNDHPDPQLPPLKQANRWLTRQYILGVVLVALTFAAFYLCYLMLSPFSNPLAWALALAVVAHPLHLWLEARL